MTRTQIYLPKTQIETLRQIAQRKRVSMSEVIRFLIKEGLEQPPAKKEGLLDFAKRVNKYGIKAPRDLATNLDKYLYEKK